MPFPSLLLSKSIRSLRRGFAAHGSTVSTAEHEGAYCNIPFWRAVRGFVPGQASRPLYHQTLPRDYSVLLKVMGCVVSFLIWQSNSIYHTHVSQQHNAVGGNHYDWRVRIRTLRSACLSLYGEGFSLTTQSASSSSCLIADRLCICLDLVLPCICPRVTASHQETA